MQLQIQEHLLFAWPVLCDFFYKDFVEVTVDNAYGLLALSRQLLVSKLEQYCRSFIAEQLSPANCVANLFEAVRFDDEGVQQDCIALVAAGFQHTYAHTTSGLPPQVMLDILQHPGLAVQCEAQVLEFVVSYVKSTELDETTARKLFQEVRWLFLSNARLTELQAEDAVPRDLLLAGALCRLSVLDQPERSAELNILPRHSYCSTVMHGLPGGCEYVDLPCHHIWELLRPKITVRVSGISEGRAKNVLMGDVHSWFSTNDSQHPPPWIELHMPSNVTILTLDQYTFSHGHHRPSYWRMCWWKTQGGASSCKLPGAAFTDLATKSHQAGNDFTVVQQQAGFALSGWRVVRLVGTGMQQDGVHKLCIKNLKLYGTGVYLYFLN
ncbi:hypothetical protein WJX72_011925 [[Myrmecia] bisecta]|uniref:BACK domain-containing protein n=1 Tax=[Myrmecia] bisecta TaxID=41462 RepID=A0AAW1QGK8_9CHLO